MSNKRRIYTLTIPEDSLQRQSGDVREEQQLEKLTGLSGDGVVNTVGSSPGEFLVQGQYRGNYAEMMAKEVRELAGSDSISSVAFYDPGDELATAGYYSVEQVRSRRFRPHRPEISDFSVQLIREGTRDSHRRWIRTDQRQVTHDWGNSSNANLGIPDAATKVRWVSEDKTQHQAASKDSTTEAEHGTVALYNLENKPSGFNSASLAYDLAHNKAGNIDSAVYDTRDNNEFDGNNNFAWQRVFQPSHEFVGNIVLENGVVRVTIDLDNNSFSVEEWDNGGSTWNSRSLNATGNWRIEDFDLIESEPARVYGQFLFYETDDDEYWTLDGFLHRGWSNIQFAIPPSKSGPIDSELVEWLDPVASSRVTDNVGVRKLLSREVLRA